MHKIRYAILFFALIIGGCAHRPPPTDPATLHVYTLDQVVKAVNDVTTGAIAANKAGQLADATTAQILTVDKQVLDVIQADPQTARDKALVIVKNARDALSANVKAVLDGWLDRILAMLEGVR